MTWRRRAAVVLTVAALAGCRSSLDLPSITGLWVAPETPAPVASGVSEFPLEIVYEGDVRSGCWSARGPEGLMPVRWPSGTVVGLEARLEVDGTVIADGDSITAFGAVLQVPTAIGTDDGAIPTGCDVDDGFYDVLQVRGADD